MLATRNSSVRMLSCVRTSCLTCSIAWHCMSGSIGHYRFLLVFPFRLKDKWNPYSINTLVWYISGFTFPLQLLVCLRMLIRRCVYENISKDEIQKLFPPEVLPELQRLLTLLLQKFQREWCEDVLKDQVNLFLQST